MQRWSKDGMGVRRMGWVCGGAADACPHRPRHHHSPPHCSFFFCARYTPTTTA
jgi:hypothetical protein